MEGLLAANMPAGIALVAAAALAAGLLSALTAAMPPVAGTVVRIVVGLAVAVVGMHMVGSAVSAMLAPLNQALTGMGSGVLPAQMPDLSWLVSVDGGMVWR